MNKILTFGASSSKNSINKQLAYYTVDQMSEVEAIKLDLNDFKMPIYSIDKENDNGIPELAKQFKQHIKDCDGIVISFAEHNGAYATVFKNIFDWISRIEKDVWDNKPMLLMATSPGARGGQSALEIAANKFKFMNDNTVLDFSLPTFYDNFLQGEGITNVELKEKHKEVLKQFTQSITK